MKYQDYLNSEDWKETRRHWMSSKSHRKCCFCGSTHKLNVHHRRYYWRGESILLHEGKKNLCTLCRECHSLWHKIHKHKATLWGDIKRIQRSIKIGIPKHDAIQFCGKTDASYIRKLFNNHGLYHGGESQGNTGDQTTDRRRACRFF